MLANEGFDIKSGDIFGAFVVDAQRDNCHLQLREAPAYGYNVDSNKERVKRCSVDIRVSRRALGQSPKVTGQQFRRFGIGLNGISR